ncbi:MAG: peptidoglycan-binding domain-containing protein [Candidatus Paceibacterota bacterium]|jgi:peptidoglycan hydrolase-like protein with peptidoglycan-binding domain
MKKLLSIACALALFPSFVAASFEQNLAYGMQGSSVFELQDVLIEKGHLTGSGPTGYFGLLTLNAVKAFQSANGIPNTGYVGMLTRGALNSIVVSATASSTVEAIVETGTTTPQHEQPLSIVCPVGYNCTPVVQPAFIQTEQPVLGVISTPAPTSIPAVNTSPNLSIGSLVCDKKEGNLAEIGANWSAVDRVIASFKGTVLENTESGQRNLNYNGGQVINKNYSHYAYLPVETANLHYVLTAYSGTHIGTGGNQSYGTKVGDSIEGDISITPCN